VRTERCIEARSRLTQTVELLNESQRDVLRHSCTRLINEALPVRPLTLTLTLALVLTRDTHP
jgi:hypothetical protein